tara:strand:- start:27614 stop:30985 length:3372 start_codon:yes stop_codon:yes gene_type:complete
MLKIGIWILLFALLSMSVFGQTVLNQEGLEYAPGELIVKLKKDVSNKITGNAISTGIRSFDELNVKYDIKNIESVYELEPLNFGKRLAKVVGIKPEDHFLRKVYKLKFSESIDVQKLVDEYSKLSKVEYAEPNYINSLSFVPNDLKYSEQWAHQNTEIEKAWDITTGSSNIIIAVIDSGVNYNHEDLEDNIWVNSGEDLNNNGAVDDSDFNDVDDDGNGYIDDIRGWDFVDIDKDKYVNELFYSLLNNEDYEDTDNDPLDFHGHGTHVAGIAGAVSNNNLGVAGVCWNCKIMGIRSAFGIEKDGVKTGGLEDDDAVNSIKYAVDNGATIISMSFGGEDSNLKRDIIDYANNKNVILVAAAGNSNTNNINNSYPAAYDDVIAVTATDSNDKRAWFSNYGYWTDIAAPGVNILSTVPDSYEPSDGTSMATPYISGVIGLVLSNYPNIDQEGLRWILKNSADSVESKEHIGSGRINVHKALSLEPISGIWANILSPIDGEIFDDPNVKNIEIKGTVEGENYILYYGPGVYPEEWHEINRGDNIGDGVLGTWNIEGLPDGIYTIKLVVSNPGGEVMDSKRIEIDLIEAGWPFKVPTDDGAFLIRDAPAIADIDDDGELEIIVIASADWFISDSHPFKESFVYALGPDGKIKWEKHYPTFLVGTPTIADPDDDGELEILLISKDAELFSLDKGGDEEWRFDGGYFSSTENTPVAIDIEGDGINEIIFPVYQFKEEYYSGMLYILNVVNSRPIEKHKREITAGINAVFPSFVSVYDIDNDGTKEIITTLNDNNVHGFGINNNALTKEWMVTNSDSKTNRKFYDKGVSIGNVDNSDPIDIIVGYSTGNFKSRIDGLASGKMLENINLIGDDPKIIWEVDLMDFDSEANNFADSISIPTLVNLDDDPEKEIVLGSQAKYEYSKEKGVQIIDKIYAFDGSGSDLLWSNDLDEVKTFENVAADINRDGKTEIIVGAWSNLYVLDNKGSIKWKFPLDSIMQSISIADLNQDGHLEILAYQNRELYVLDKDGNQFVFGGIEEGYFNPLPWPMYHHDPQRTGAYEVLKPILLGDFTGPKGFPNGCVEFDDFLMFAQGFSAFIEGKTYEMEFDFDNDRDIDVQDFFIFAENFGKGQC